MIALALSQENVSEFDVHEEGTRVEGDSSNNRCAAVQSGFSAKISESDPDKAFPPEWGRGRRFREKPSDSQIEQPESSFAVSHCPKMDASRESARQRSRGKGSGFTSGLVALRVASQPVNATRSFFDFAYRSIKIIGGKFLDALIDALIAEAQIAGH